MKFYLSVKHRTEPQPKQCREINNWKMEPPVNTIAIFSIEDRVSKT